MHTNQIPSPADVAALESRLGRRGQRVRAAPLEVLWARNADDVVQAQRLRYQVFADEMGAHLSPLKGSPDGHDIDRFDAACEHLIVRTAETDDAPSQVVGTYRVLTPAAAKRTGGLYTESEFDLDRLAALRPRMAELGRSCTAEGWRQGGVILLLWASLGEFMQRNGLDMMIGCASVPMGDGGHVAASLWNTLRQKYLAAPERLVQARLRLPVDDLNGDLDVEPPPLIKGYLRCGARVLGAPAWDPDFGVADLPLMIDLNELPAIYRKRFMGH
ncbi:MAG: GNAT family N-acyltransferase [Ideonella sp.]